MATYVSLSARLLRILVFVQLGALKQFVRAEPVSCAAAQFYDSATAACTSCPTGCSACTSSTSCSGCRTGYFASSSSCFKCSSGCAACDSLASCSTCQDRYYSSPANSTNTSNTSNGSNASNNAIGSNTSNGGSCQSCASNCLKCTGAVASACTLCEDGWFLDTVGCVVCPPSCEVCKSKTTCERCAPTLVWDPTTASCVAATGGTAGRRSAGTTAALSTAAIVGISAGSFGSLVLAGFGIYCLIKQCKRNAYLEQGKNTADLPIKTGQQIPSQPDSTLEPLKPALPGQAFDQAQVKVKAQNLPLATQAAPEPAAFDEEFPEVREENHLKSARGASHTTESTPLRTQVVVRKSDL